MIALIYLMALFTAAALHAAVTVYRRFDKSITPMHWSIYPLVIGAVTFCLLAVNYIFIPLGTYLENI